MASISSASPDPIAQDPDPELRRLAAEAQREHVAETPPEAAGEVDGGSEGSEDDLVDPAESNTPFARTPFAQHIMRRRQQFAEMRAMTEAPRKDAAETRPDDDVEAAGGEGPKRRKIEPLGTTLPSLGECSLSLSLSIPPHPPYPPLPAFTSHLFQAMMNSHFSPWFGRQLRGRRTRAPNYASARLWSDPLTLPKPS
jgi:hypothetical protein